ALGRPAGGRACETPRIASARRHERVSDQHLRARTDRRRARARGQRQSRGADDGRLPGGLPRGSGGTVRRRTPALRERLPALRSEAGGAAGALGAEPGRRGTGAGARGQRGAAPARGAMTEPRRFAGDALLAFAERIVHGLGASPAAARTVGASLVEADRRGIHTHGVVRLPSYCSEARAGRIRVTVTPALERDDGPVAAIDGGGGFGAVTGTEAMAQAIARAE